MVRSLIGKVSAVAEFARIRSARIGSEFLRIQLRSGELSLVQGLVNNRSDTVKLTKLKLRSKPSRRGAKTPGNSGCFDFAWGLPVDRASASRDVLGPECLLRLEIGNHD